MTFELWDYRRQVSDIYAEARAGGAGRSTWNRWRSRRDHLFSSHTETALEDPSSFQGLPYFPYDSDWRTVGLFTPSSGERRTIGHSGPGETRFLVIGHVDFEAPGHAGRLTVLWLDSYGGGVFLPFRDATNGDTTYGGGRYLLDSGKGADLGHDGKQVTLDFNYAYHPSCVHSDRWSCPLAPPENRLSFPVTSGERLSAGPEAP